MHGTPLKLTWRKKTLFAVIPMMLLLFSTEAILWLLGYESPVADPYDSFVLRRPLFQSHDLKSTTSYARRKFFHLQTFVTSKPKKTTSRVFVFGGSVTFGDTLPNPQRDSYVNQLGTILESEFSGTRFEMINCGGLSYASYRLVDLVEECLNYSPDLVIIMSGHNEFVEARHYANLIAANSAPNRLWYSLRTVRLLQHLSNQLKRSKPVLGEPRDPNVPVEYLVWEEQEFDYALDHYSRNMHRMVDACKRYRTPVILCTCPSNLLDQPPFDPGSISEAEYQLTGKGMQLLNAGKYEEALALALGALRAKPRSPYLHYIAGKCYFGLNRMEEAKLSLMRAKDTDTFPHRALSTFNEVVRNTARQTDAYLFDAERLFASESEHGIPGENLFVDDCHPTKEGHRLIAEGLGKISAKILGPEN